MKGGGLVILGVTDAGHDGRRNSKRLISPSEPARGCASEFPLSIDFEEIPHPDCSPGSRVLVFRVPPRPVGIPIKYDGRYWMRKEDSLVEMSEERLRAIFAESGHDFSADVCPGLGLGGPRRGGHRGLRQRWIAKARKAEDMPLAERLSTLNLSSCWRMPKRWSTASRTMRP